MCVKYDLAFVSLQHMTFYLLHKNNFFSKHCFKVTYQFTEHDIHLEVNIKDFTY